MGTPRAQAAEPFLPATNGPGPLLVFYTEEVAPPRLGKAVKTELHIFNPQHHREPQPIWRGSGEPPVPIVLVGSQHLVMERSVLNLATGRTRVLLDTERPVEILLIDGDRIYFSERYANHSFGPQTAVRDGLVIAADEQQARYRLHCLDVASGGPASQFTTLEVEAILGRADGALWVVSSGEPRHLYRLPLRADAVPEQIIAIDKHWSLSDPQMAISPSKKYLAITASHEQRDFLTQRLLAVIDLVKNEFVFVKDDIYQRQFG
jgi:hypothetical protein